MKPNRPFSFVLLKKKAALTLVELLAVIAIAVVLFALVTPAIVGVKGASDLTNSVSSIQGILDQARTYAIANNTYTWVGVLEQSSAQAQTGLGGLVLCIVASRDGTCLYSKTQAKADNATTQALPLARLVAIGKPTRLNNIRVLNAASQPIGKRPAGVIRDQDLVGLTSKPPLFSFQYPLSGKVEYTFGVRSGGASTANGIVQFNPQGEAVSDAGPVSNPATLLEIAVGRTGGNSANIIAIDVNGLTGQVAIHRP